MSGSDLKSNSLKLRFESGSQEPTETEIFDFMRGKMKLKADDLLSMYKDRLDASIIIKFKAEEKYKATLANLPGTMEFNYNKHLSARVHLSSACTMVKYVRLFNLPPEVQDLEIGPVLAKYGKVQRLVREKYGEETGFPIWTSVRGAYVELKDGTEIPATVYVRNIRARVFHEGLINKCFICGAEGHIKSECPNKMTANLRLEAGSRLSYSDTVAGGGVRWTKPILNTTALNEENQHNMTNLNALLESVVPKRSDTSTVSKKRQLSLSNPSSSDETEIIDSMETDDTKSKTDNASSCLEQQQQEEQKQTGKQNCEGEGDGWSLVAERKGRKPKASKIVVSSTSVGPSVSSEPHNPPLIRVPRSVRITELQSKRNQELIRAKAKKNESNTQQNLTGEVDDLEETFLAKEFDR